ncbi:pentatricopeptide repeat-containing protein at1g31920 [Phtheirospermum japonicum]|uniref:Pentatricopeptide repeat-containing protein at1g31920 n=1 Tax=Phtheirospermum japonicum TaxID=374723 RepID=A0A830CSS4_9LAMI|nr:pentatricopeptide repeat-containing protein at1g31920 [Phtheirospermum japonicum]
MYGKCGLLRHSCEVFEKMDFKTIASWSALIAAHANLGRGEEALVIFEQMLRNGLKPDDVTYVGVLSACSHSGLVEKGTKYFDSMRFEHRINPTIQHYGCMVDLMGRAGLVREALDLIKSMPMEPNDVIWRSLLSSCKVHRNVELGELAAENLFKLNTRNAGDYIMMSNIYAQARRWQDVSLTRVKMANEGLGQVVGSSSVEVNRKVRKFVSYDKSHFDFREIYEMLHQMAWQLKFEGYLPDTTQVLLDVDEEEKRERLGLHSQKLAIAFSLIHTFEGSPIRIVRNVRMCSDCHTYTKLISVIYQREIVVKDRNVFHCFREGACSCKDYW